MSTLKRRILAIPQSIHITSISFLLMNNLQSLSLSEKQFFLFLFFMQLQLLISIPFNKIFVRHFLITLLLQNTTLLKTTSLQTPTVFSILMTKSIYYSLVIFTYILQYNILAGNFSKKKH